MDAPTFTAIPANAYVRLVIDEVFAKEHWINEIVWKRSDAHWTLVPLGKVHDTLFSTGGRSNHMESQHIPQ